MVLPLIKKASVPVIIVITIIIVMVVLSNGCAAVESVETECPPPVARVPQCPFGQPVQAFPSERASYSLGVVVRDQYSIGYLLHERNAVWACETMEAAELDGEAKRKTYFAKDPLLAKFHQASFNDYTGTGYDRAHVVAANNHRWSQQRMDETFYMTNVTPMQPSFNRGIWRQFEDWVRARTRHYGSMYSITGAVFIPSPKYTDGFKYLVHNVGHSYIPTHFYKVLVSKRGTKSWHAIAFLFDHEEDHTAPHNWREYVVSISLIESMTDLNLMPNLSDTNQVRMEAKAANFDLWVK
jgi:endonuclease G